MNRKAEIKNLPNNGIKGILVDDEINVIITNLRKEKETINNTLAIREKYIEDLEVENRKLVTSQKKNDSLSEELEKTLQIISKLETEVTEKDRILRLDYQSALERESRIEELEKLLQEKEIELTEKNKGESFQELNDENKTRREIVEEKERENKTLELEANNYSLKRKISEIESQLITANRNYREKNEEVLTTIINLQKEKEEKEKLQRLGTEKQEFIEQLQDQVRRLQYIISRSNSMASSRLNTLNFGVPNVDTADLSQLQSVLKEIEDERNFVTESPTSISPVSSRPNSDFIYSNCSEFFSFLPIDQKSNQWNSLTISNDRQQNAGTAKKINSVQINELELNFAKLEELEAKTKKLVSQYTNLSAMVNDSTKEKKIENQLSKQSFFLRSLLNEKNKKIIKYESEINFFSRKISDLEKVIAEYEKKRMDEKQNRKEKEKFAPLETEEEVIDSVSLELEVVKRTMNVVNEQLIDEKEEKDLINKLIININLLRFSSGVESLLAGKEELRNRLSDLNVTSDLEKILSKKQELEKKYQESNEQSNEWLSQEVFSQKELEEQMMTTNQKKKEYEDAQKSFQKELERLNEITRQNEEEIEELEERINNFNKQLQEIELATKEVKKQQKKELDETFANKLKQLEEKYFEAQNDLNTIKIEKEIWKKRYNEEIGQKQEMINNLQAQLSNHEQQFIQQIIQGLNLELDINSNLNQLISKLKELIFKPDLSAKLVAAQATIHELKRKLTTKDHDCKTIQQVERAKILQLVKEEFYQNCQNYSIVISLPVKESICQAITYQEIAEQRNILFQERLDQVDNNLQRITCQKDSLSGQLKRERIIFGTILGISILIITKMLISLKKRKKLI